MTDNQPFDFVSRGRFDGPDLVGARWWNQSFEDFAARPNRRTVLGLPLQVFGVGSAIAIGIAFCNVFGDDDEVETSLAALELQKREGWNAGYSSMGLTFPALPASEAMRNSIGMLFAPAGLTGMAQVLLPEPRLRPYAVSTLFQALDEPSNTSLRDAIRPVHTPAMDQAYARGQALRELMARPDAPAGVALIVDLPGPEAVALAAGLAERFAPVFTFDNWPHPLGVVPSHLTLGATAYYYPQLMVASARRPPDPMPAFVLDANRLSPYRDDANQFDNRYVAPVPSADGLQRLGIKRLLYLRPDGASLTELDDLNADFVEWERAGIEVRAVALSDFSAQQDAIANPATATAATTTHYYYGGHAHYHPFFWRSYGWTSVATSAPARLTPPPTRLSAAPAYRPAFRPTMFASRTIGGAAGFGKQKPSGFGRVSVRMAGARVSSFGSGSRRSGSFTRSRSSFFG
jgi:hypothetical protein